MTPRAPSPADAAAASGRRCRCLPAAIAEIRRHADGGQQQADDAAAVRHVETIEPCAFHESSSASEPGRQQLLAGNGADGRCFAQQLRVAAVAGLLYFLPPAAAGRRLPTGPARAAAGDSRWCAASAGSPALTGRAPAEGTGDLRGGGIMVEQRQLAKQGAVGGLQRDAQARQRRLIQ